MDRRALPHEAALGRVRPRHACAFPTTLAIVKVAIAALLLSACGVFSKPETFPDQAKAARDAQARLGRLDASLQPVAGHEGTWSARSDKKLVFSSNSDGRSCIQLSDGRQFMRSHDSLDKVLAEDSDIVAKVTFVFTTYDSLDHVGAWPDRAGGAPGALVDHNVTKQEHTWSDGSKGSDTEWLDETFEWCGPTPAVQPTTRYFTVTSFSPEGPPTLFVWAVDPAP